MDVRDFESPPKHDDAILLLAVLNAPVGDEARAGMELLWTYREPPSLEELVQAHEVNSPGYGQVMALLTVGERLGTFVKNGVLHQRLTLELIGMHAVWSRTERIIADLRRERSNPKLFENLEWLATRPPA
ncbi:MAG TPA: hypothetical protein PLG60_01200 [Acidimicrobiales bacterium]|nr:hypothetical protein [Acidimicrobiales bacterium]